MARNNRLDRLSRRLDDAAAILDRLAGASVTLRTVNESFDTSTPQGRIIEQIVAVFAGYLRETAMERGESGQRRNAARPRATASAGHSRRA